MFLNYDIFCGIWYLNVIKDTKICKNCQYLVPHNKEGDGMLRLCWLGM